MNDAVPVPRRDSDKHSLVVRFAGDSGDGIQLTGHQYTLETALQGNDLATFPDFPAEIRAPAGTLFGVSAFQIHFGDERVRTAGDELDVLVALNPAALKTNLADLRRNGIIIVDTGTFVKKNLQKAEYADNPLENNSLDNYRVLKLDISKLTQEAVRHCDVSNREGLRARNLWTLGLILWLTGRERQATTSWLNAKFANTPNILEANLAALNAGHAFGETAELPRDIAELTGAFEQAPLAAGEYRNLNGTDGICWGLVTGGQLAGLPLVYCSYPITPASNMLHTLARLHEYGVTTFQAEDEIAAICAAIGASYAGALGITGSSGPGLALKTEAMGLAITTELPLVIVNAQRGGPSTGLPTKTEQSDLFQAVWGRNGDSPLVVVAARSASDCFECAIEAVRLATRYMTPVILLTDGYLANASEPWRIPSFKQMQPFPVEFRTNPDRFAPYQRDPETLARPWVAPGTPGLAHRIGGIEKADITGNISYDPANHQRMTDLRRQKILNIADNIPEQSFELGNEHDDLLVVGWGSTYGPIYTAVENLRNQGVKVSHIHLRHIWPLPRNLGALLGNFERILVPEMNTGQLLKLLRAEYCAPAQGLNKIAGKPFKVSEVEHAIRSALQESPA
jgi:2-oxoglutarate ferredoxin oxidoreductase subunit alpha